MDEGVLTNLSLSFQVVFASFCRPFRVHAREPKSSILYKVRNAYPPTRQSVNTAKKTNDASLRESEGRLPDLRGEQFIGSLESRMSRFRPTQPAPSNH
jgi:hypothetical protein